jgi:hypothetical protein
MLPLVVLCAAPQQAGSKGKLAATQTKTVGAKRSNTGFPLTSIEAVTDIDAPRDPDDPGAGGGVDAAGFFSRRLALKIGTCTAKIRTATDTWGKQQQLVASKIDQQPGDLLMHLGKPDLLGFFELTYRVRLQQERARVTLLFYTADGTQRDPAAIRKMLSEYRIDGFQDNLTKALLCED